MNSLDDFGRLPLHHAASANRFAEAELRLNAGDDPNHADQDGFTPLHFAAQEGALEVLRLLLEWGGRVDAANRFGNTPLWIAVFNFRDRGDLIVLLREHGADPHRPNNSGRTPLELARTIANYDVARYFADLPSTSGAR